MRRNQKHRSLSNTANKDLIGINTLLDQLGMPHTIINREWALRFWEGELKWSSGDRKYFKGFSPERVEFIKKQSKPIK